MFLHPDVSEEHAASKFRVNELFRVFPQDLIIFTVRSFCILKTFITNEPDSSVGLVTSLQSSKENVKFALEQATKAQRGVKYNSTLSLTSALDGMGGQSHAPAAIPRERPGTHCIGGRSGRVRKISHPPGFDPRTAQPVASRYIQKL